MKNDKNNLEFTHSENKVRKIWLFSSMLLPVFLLGVFTIVAISKFFISPSFETMIAILAVLLFSIGELYISYYCAYKHPGTILLLLHMIGNGLCLLCTLLTIKTSLKQIAYVDIVLMLWNVILFYFSYRLRQVNKAMRERRITTSPMYTHALSIFLTATNLNELNEQFANLRSAYDNGEIAVNILNKAYLKQKKLLHSS